jgi:hypothetical protein
MINRRCNGSAGGVGLFVKRGVARRPQPRFGLQIGSLRQVFVPQSQKA